MVATQRTASPIHPASLVDSSSHSQAILEMIETDMSRTLIDYVVDTVVETVDYAMGSASSSRGRSISRRNDHAKFSKFVTEVLQKAEVKVPALLVTLVYIHRAKPHLQIALEQWANERVFLGALILANKYLNDSTLKNVHWALCTGVFGKRDIGRIEREFLDVLDFELGITESDLLSHHAHLMTLIHPHRHSIRAPIRRRSVGSRWSSDSSDMESVSSAESTSPPRTPDIAMEVDSASYVSPSSKPDSHSSSAASQQFSAPTAVQTKESHHQRLSSALNILRSFPMPHFHHNYATQTSSTSSSSLSTTASASSAASSGARCAGRCKPIAPAAIVTSRTASVFA
ncbi:hypothetical protein EIP91_001996 [Steccherinum ochraceum]|uniref:Cyclin N-terminal domain-containing protein n=1 Tax=Steccherinum ochraceum TaxID=92696 RepID=A0A4R0RQ46_9APHY|nr:hypothetical protein EIP91_001996 [Steccherinum ochraceum]